MKRTGKDFWGLAVDNVLFLDLVASSTGVSVCENSLCLTFMVWA